MLFRTSAEATRRSHLAKLVPREGILDIAPYIGGNAGADGISDLINLASNESALGQVPKQ